MRWISIATVLIVATLAAVATAPTVVARAALVDDPSTPVPRSAESEAAAVKKAIDSITAGDAIETVTTLTQDAWEGRCAGYPGCKKAGDWIGERFKEMGLKPVGDNQSHFQTFTFKARGKNRGGKPSKRKKGSLPAPSAPHTETPTSRNVVGLLQGSHRQFRDQLVIIGGHYDHVGRQGQWNAGRRGSPKGTDDVWNGADDNASGASAVLELAQAFTSSGVKPKRSILFICFSAEEHGLFGAKWYCDHPLFPLNKTVAMINLDMVGYNHKKEFEVVGVDHASGKVIRKAVVKAMKKVRGFRGKLQSWAKREDSDHAPFIKVGVPATFFFSGMHKDYHTANDEVGGISGKRIANVCKVVFLTVLNLANLPKQPKFVHWNGQGGSAQKLGITGRALTKMQLRRYKLRGKTGALRVTKVVKDSLAAKAGVKENDVILSVAGVRLSRGKEMDRLARGMKKKKPGSTLVIRVIRGTKRKVLKVKIP